ncbi:hypothetical protein V5O48_016057 [Marasmius crinis-equi]|uniref:F-box domain-containing protein n=1 Tax=Marasmius crinis-equi TaxID=585013 RepID=A0ABR3ESU3_9AGAR
MPTTTTITSLPPETFEQILFLLDPLDVAAISQTSRYFYDIVYSPTPSTSNQTQHPNPNQYLWRNLYLAQPFDDPLQCYSTLGRRLTDEENDFDWKKELQEIIRARTIVESYSRSSPSKTTITAQDRIRALRALLNLVIYVPPLRSYEDLLKEDKMSANLMWVAAECRRGALLDPLPQSHSQSPTCARTRESRHRLGSVFGEEPGGEDDDEDNEQVEETPPHDPPTTHELKLRAKLHIHLGLTPHD